MWYALGMLSYNIEYMIIAQLSYALTESYAFSAMTAGTIFLVSRLFDGVTDIAAGYLIDRFRPKVGKARVYDLLHLPLWICLVLTFSVPDIGMTGKIIWVFIFYNLLQSVMATFMNVAEPLRLQRSFSEEGRIKAMTVNSIIVLIFGIVYGVTFPVLVEAYGKQPGGWTKITMIFAIPMVICGLCRFVFLKEMPEAKALEEKQAVPKLSDSFKALFTNKYALLYGGIMICWAMYTTITNGTATYFFQYIYGNISAASIVALPMLLVPVFLVALPKIMGKFGQIPTLRVMLALTVVFVLSKTIFPTNLPWLTFSGFICTCGTMTLGFLKPILTINCIKYGKWKTGNAVEAAYSTVNSLTDKIGLGLGSLLMGTALELAGYDGSLEVQAESAKIGILMLNSAIPAILMLGAVIILLFFNLEKKLPQIEADLAEREASLQ